MIRYPCATITASVNHYRGRESFLTVFRGCQCEWSTDFSTYDSNNVLEVLGGVRK